MGCGGIHQRCTLSLLTVRSSPCYLSTRIPGVKPKLGEKVTKATGNRNEAT